MIKFITEHPIAYESPDHILPWGTMRDNSTNPGFIIEAENMFNGKQFTTLDIGCSGGQLTIDFAAKGHIAVGIEGSDYSIKHQRANWPEYHNKNLFTADATKPFKFEWPTGDTVKFDLITAWELIEHIHPNDLNALFKNIAANLSDNGIFVGSISQKEDVIDGVVLHQSVFNEIDWRFKILQDDAAFAGTDLEVVPYPFTNKVRADYGSFHIGVKHKSKDNE
jgi:SAM-dependent methyltransferase